MGAPNNKLIQEQDLKNLKTLFYQYYDKCLISQKIAQLITNGTQLPYLGGGRHFDAYLFNSGEFTFSINIADEEFSKNSITGEKSWAKQMATLAKKNLRLLPPFDVLTFEDRVVLVLPYGESDTLKLKAHWNPLPPIIRSFVRELRELGFEIQDSIQVRSRQGVPFIHDFSDLTAV